MPKPRSWMDCLKIMSDAIDNGWSPSAERRERRARGEETVYSHRYIMSPRENIKKMDTKLEEKKLLEQFITALSGRVKAMSLNVQSNGKNYRIATMQHTLKSLISEVYGQNLSFEDKIEILGILESVKIDLNS